MGDPINSADQKMNGYAKELKPYVGGLTCLAISGLSGYRVWQGRMPLEKAVSIGVFVHQVLNKLEWLPPSLQFKEIFNSLRELGSQQKSIKIMFWVTRTIRELFTS